MATTIAPSAKSLSAAPYKVIPNAGFAVIEHHDFVDHREFEMRVRIVERESGKFLPA